MAEFKVAKALSEEVSEFQSAGNKISSEFTGTSNDSVSTLSTAQKYIAQEKEIKALLDLYKKLIQKDATDMYRMISEVELMDESIASANK